MSDDPPRPPDLPVVHLPWSHWLELRQRLADLEARVTELEIVAVKRVLKDG
jgi:hypothetical protein